MKEFLVKLLDISFIRLLVSLVFSMVANISAGVSIAGYIGEYDPVKLKKSIIKAVGFIVAISAAYVACYFNQEIGLNYDGIDLTLLSAMVIAFRGSTTVHAVAFFGKLLKVLGVGGKLEVKKDDQVYDDNGGQG